MNKIDNPQKNIGNNKKLLNAVKFYVAMTIAGLLATPVFSQTNTNNGINIEINEISLQKYQEMLKARDKYISQMDGTYMDQEEYFVLNKKKLFLKSYETNRNSTKTYINKIKEILNNKFDTNLADDPILILKTALEIISTEENMNVLDGFTNKLTEEFDMNMIDAYGYIQALYPELCNNKNLEGMPTYRIDDGQTLKKLIDILENGKFTVKYENVINGDTEKTQPVIDNENSQEDEGFVSIEDLTGDKNEKKPVVDENENTEPVVEDDTEENQPIIEDDNSQENEGFVSMEDLTGDKNENKPIIDENENTEPVIEDNTEENQPVIEDDTEKTQPVIDNENSQEDEGFVSIEDLTGDKNKNEPIIDENENIEPVIEDNTEENQPIVEDENSQKEKNLSKEEKMQEWVGDELEEDLSSFGKISSNGDSIEIKLISPNYKSLVETELSSKLGPFMQALKTITYVEGLDRRIVKIVMERDFVEEMEIDTSMSVLYDFNNELSQKLPISQQKEKIYDLMDTHPVIKDFVLKLNKVGINMGSDFGINRVAAILRIVNGNFKAGNEMLDLAIDGNVKGGDVVGHMILQSWAMNLDGYQINLIFNNFQNPVNLNKNNGNGKITLPVTEDMLEINKKEQENLKIVREMSWNADVLSKKLDQDKLNGVTYQEIIDVVNGFKSPELQKAFMFKLLNNDVVSAQSIMGMSLTCDYRYPDYKAGNKIGKSELSKIKKLGQDRKYLSKSEIMNHQYIPKDVKVAYGKFENGRIDNHNRPYSIISKTDFRLYMFSADHKLLAYQNTLLGMDKGDKKNNPYIGSQTTPGGIYEIGNRFDKNPENNESFFEKYGTHYIILVPMEGQYDMTKIYSMGVHGTYDKDPSRDPAINSLTANKNITNGCVNTKDEKYGEIYNHFVLGGIVYVTFEPSNSDLQEYLSSNQ